ncbi:MAG: DUF2865 domain-containing protein [Methylobacteriaceae bacterium]|nr:DUF2865 domain-containing protein [Methylobacteriaceae bacterium]
MRSSSRHIAFASALVLAGALLCGAARAQSVDCNRLQAQIAQANAADPATERFAAAAQKQRAELDRTVAYAHSIGCDRSGFVFFGPQPPAQCPAINAQIQRMRGNVAQLQGQMSGGARGALVAQYNAYCRGGAQVATAQPRGFFEQLFGGGFSAQPEIMAPAPEDETPRGGSMAVCVKSCDGSFFPVSYSAHRGNLGELNDLCQALCPNSEVTLYTRSLYRDMKSAVSINGEPYRDMQNAFKFEKAVEPACACKAPGQTWVQALADAERVLGGQRRGDMIVTPQQAEELSRPKEAKADAKGRGKPEASPKKPTDDLSAIEAQAAAQAPTASSESAGISAGTVRGGKSYGIGEGELRDVVGPDGIKRQLRVVGPTL